MNTTEKNATELLDDDLSEFEIASKREIFSILSNIKNKNVLIKLQIPANENDTGITTILNIDSDNQLIIIDSTPEDSFNQRFTKSTNLIFDCLLDQIRVIFIVPKASICIHDKKHAIQLNFPNKLIRLQRREYFRAPTPVSNPVICRVPNVELNENKTTNFPLRNISSGGMMLLDEKVMLDITSGKKYQGCTICFPDNEAVSATIEIRNCHPHKLHNGTIANLVGVKFIDLKNVDANRIQKYIHKLEQNKK